MTLRKVTCPHCNAEISKKILMKPRLGQAVRCPHCSNLFMNAWKTELLGGLFTGLTITVLIGLALGDIIPSVFLLIAGAAIIVMYVTVLNPLLFSARPYDHKSGHKQIIVLLVSTVLFTSMILYGVLGAFPLIVAAKTGNTFIVKLLISLGADPNTKNNGITSRIKVDYPLESAIVSGQKDVVAVLIDHGADIHSPDRLGGKPIHRAALEGKVAIVSLLLSKGADVNAQYGNLGVTPLMIAADNGYEDVAKTLIANGAEVNIQGKFIWEMSPLMLAAQNCHEGLVKLLLANGADVSLKTDLGQTVYSVAKGCQNREIMRLLSQGKKYKR